MRVVSFNIGAYDARAHTSKKKAPEFGAKLEGDLRKFVHSGTSILLLQEVNDYWYKEVTEIMGESWAYVRGSNGKTVTAVRKGDPQVGGGIHLARRQGGLLSQLEEVASR